MPASRTRTRASSAPGAGSGPSTQSTRSPSKWRARTGRRSGHPEGARTAEGAAPPAGRGQDEGPRIVLEEPAGEVPPGPGVEPGGPDGRPGPGPGPQDHAEGSGEPDVGGEVVVHRGPVAPADGVGVGAGPGDCL